MTAEKDKIAVYELHIESMLNALTERLGEFGPVSDLSELEQGRFLAYQEMLEIIQTRYRIIWDVIAE